MAHSPLKADLLIETSWEVCNKVGGIYTVLSTKARSLKRLYRDNLIFLGPDVWTPANPSPYFTPCPTPLDQWAAAANLPHGIKVRTGRWDIPGQPLVVLVSFDTMYPLNDTLYATMWDNYGVDSLHAYGDYGEAAAFSHAAGIVINSLVNHLQPRNPIAHFDEWTTGMALLYTRLNTPKAATVFTTHATSIGRSICGNNKPLYDYFQGYNGDQMAAELNMQSKHSLEKAAAHNAHSFTTVSDVTARECTQLLDITPHTVTPNGFENDFVPTPRPMAQARTRARQALLHTAGALLGRQLPADTLIIATSGRCEYRNKGIDIYLDALATVAHTHPHLNILALTLVPAWSDTPRADLAARLAAPGPHTTPLPRPHITHNLHNPGQDPIDNRIQQLNLNNPAANLNTLYIPCYLDGNDGILGHTYYDLLPALDLTIFPSYYEPWGYTPLESIAFHIPTVTTTLSGFGQWVNNTLGNDPDATGVSVLERTDSNYHTLTQAIARTIIDQATATPARRKATATAAATTAAAAQWKHFIQHYTQAYTQALTNRNNQR